MASKRSPALARLLKRLVAEVGEPEGRAAQARLVRNRRLQEALMSAAYDAAEVYYPGLKALFEELCAAERELMRKAGPQA